MKNLLNKMLLCGSVLGLSLALGACREEEKAQPEPPRPVRTVIAKPTVVDQEVVQTGEIKAHIDTDLGFRIDGRVATRNVEVGAIVKKGQLLATLDPHDVENEVRSAEAGLARAEAAEALAKSALDRQRTLFKKHIVTRVKVEEAEAGWREANAQTKGAQSALQSARNKLTYTELRAPNEGIVSAIAINSGQVVPASQVGIKLASLRERDAVFNVSERLFIAAPEDVRVEVALVSDPKIKVIGSLRDASPSADPVTRTYRVRIALPDAPPVMTLGAAVTGRLVTTSKPLFVLPASALTNEDGKTAVFVVQSSTHELVRKRVTVARYAASEVLVESGLEEGDAVVTAGVSKLRPAQKVVYGDDAGEVRK